MASRSTCSVDDCDKPVKGHGWCDTHYARWRRTGGVELKQYPKICTLDGCDGDVLARGWCSKHYERWKRHGDPEADVIERNLNPPEACTIEGCDGEHKGRGFCRKHYWRFREHGDPLAGGPALILAPEDGLCSIEGCERPHHARGFCDNHYRRWERHSDPEGGREGPAERPEDGLCVIPSCDRPIQRRGLCGPHRRRLQKYGDPLGGTDWYKEPGNPDGSCIVETCEESGSKGRNMCMTHYSAWHRSENQEIYRDRSRRRYAQQLGATILPFHPELIPERMSMFARCWICGDSLEDGYHVDHVKPLARGGAHTLANLRPACPICNMSKNAAWPFDTSTGHLRLDPARLP